MVDEEQIEQMSYLFFEDIMEELGHKLNYEAVVNYAGNSFVEKSWDMIMDSNPMAIGDGKTPRGKNKSDMVSFFNQARVVKHGSKDVPNPIQKG